MKRSMKHEAGSMIKRTEILNLAISLAAILASYLIWRDFKICLSIAIGSAIGGANFWALYKVVTGFVGANGGRLKFAVFAFLKFFILIFTLWAVIKWAPVSAPAFLVGLSTVVMAILLMSLRGAPATKQSPETH